MTRVKVAFMAPTGKGGPHFLYKELVNYLGIQYQGELDVYFYHTKKDWISLHFRQFDYIISVVPFLFKPIGCKNYFVNIHGNYKLERKNFSVGRSLLYLMEWNMKRSSGILVNSPYLIKVLNLPSHAYVIENFVDDRNTLLERGISNNTPIKLLTVSSSQFKEKADGLVDLASSLTKLGKLNREFEWIIVAGGNDEVYAQIKQEISGIPIPSCCTIRYLDRQTKSELEKLYFECDIFLYGTHLDTWGLTIMEAMINGLPVALLPYDAREYIYPKDIVTSDIVGRIEDILNEYENESKKSYSFAKQFSLKKIGSKRYSLLTSNKSCVNNASIIQFNTEQHNKVATNYYKRHPEIYNEIEQQRVRSTLEYCIGFLEKKHCNVLDYGSGTGNLTNHFLKLGCTVTALDISKKSLDLLAEKYAGTDFERNLHTVVFDGVKSEIDSNSYDCVATYSVLHHVPDYFDAIKEMMRLTKPGGLLIIDHEASEGFREKSKELMEFYSHKNSLINKLKKVLYSNELFTFDFWRGLCIRTFINNRRRNEGDIHVFNDDHIERELIIGFFEKENRRVIKDEKHLLFDIFVKKSIYDKYANMCDDMRCMIFQKPH